LTGVPPHASASASLAARDDGQATSATRQRHSGTRIRLARSLLGSSAPASAAGVRAMQAGHSCDPGGDDFNPAQVGPTTVARKQYIRERALPGLKQMSLPQAQAGGRVQAMVNRWAKQSSAVTQANGTVVLVWTFHWIAISRVITVAQNDRRAGTATVPLHRISITVP